MTRTKLSALAPAKINLYLEVTARRADGYHDIDSVMQTVTLFDTVTLTLGDRMGQLISVECPDTRVPCGEKNLCHRAAALFFDAAEITDYDVTVEIEKNIPMAAGLGGGSSDAAAVLILLNELYGANFTTEKLCAIGSMLGADVPFCIMQGISIARGIGDVFIPCPRLPECTFVIACIGEGVSTPWAYGQLDEMYDFSERNASSDAFVSALMSGDIDSIANEMTNIFESVVLPERNEASELRDMLTSFGAKKAMMSGSGPSIFGVFANEELAADAANQLMRRGIKAQVCKPYYPEKTSGGK